MSLVRKPFPGIAFRGDGARRRAWLVGSGLDVWEVVQLLDDFGDPEAVTAAMPVSPSQLRLAMAYRDAYPDEIADAIADNRRPISDAAVLFPFITIADT